MGKLKSLWNNVRYSLWFVPSLSVLMAMACAFGLIELDSYLGLQLQNQYPLFFGVSAEGARAMLSAIATSVITVAGVSFSITIVALSLAATQYTSRVLRNFMRDRSNQFTLGTLMGIFVYCLVVLRTIRGGEQPFVPVISVVGALLLAILGISMFIFFIHHIASNIEASTILCKVAGETVATVEKLFPENLGQGVAKEETRFAEAVPDKETWSTVLAESSGFIQTVEPDAMLKVAAENEIVIRMEYGIGDFVIRATPLVSICGTSQVEAKLGKSINGLFGIQSHRDIDQDPGFGIRQIVDIALKALSPGINDPTTAVICLNYLATILQVLIHREIPSRYRVSEGKLRVIACGPTFKELLDQMFSEIRQGSRDCVAVQIVMLDVIKRMMKQKIERSRGDLLMQHARLVEEHAATFVKCAHDQRLVSQRFNEVAEIFASQ